MFGLVDKLLSSVTSVTYKIETLNDASKVSISTFRRKTKIINFLLERLTVTVSQQVIQNHWIPIPGIPTVLPGTAVHCVPYSKAPTKLRH